MEKFLNSTGFQFLCSAIAFIICCTVISDPEALVGVCGICFGAPIAVMVVKGIFNL